MLKGQVLARIAAQRQARAEISRSLAASASKDNSTNTNININNINSLSTGAPSSKVAKGELEKELARRFSGKINLDQLYGLSRNLSAGVINDIGRSAKKADGDKYAFLTGQCIIRITLTCNEIARTRYTDKSDRATVEQVLDPRTRMIIFKLLNRGTITEINGCISTGKEANVYHATGEHGNDMAVKIYKTSILTFKDRDRYVTGEYRFRHGYSKHNPRKMVKTWAEKEMRNLRRLHQVCPRPTALRTKNFVNATKTNA